MTNSQNFFAQAGLAAVAIGLLLVVGLQATRPVEVSVTPPDGYGALSGPDISSPYLSWGGIAQYNYGPAITATSSVFCSVGPFTATSTIIEADTRITGNTLGATQTFDISTSSTAVGSSSPALILAASVSASPGVANPDIVVWQPFMATSSTVSTRVLGLSASPRTNGSSLFTVNTGDYVNWRIATGTPLANTGQLSGKCLLRTTRI